MPASIAFGPMLYRSKNVQLNEDSIKEIRPDRHYASDFQSDLASNQSEISAQDAQERFIRC